MQHIRSLSSPYAPLDLAEVMRTLPSIGQTAAHVSRSEKYAQVTTADVLTKMDAQGFKVFAASEARVVKADRKSFQRHMVRLRHESVQYSDKRAPEITLLNDHCGTGGFRIISGLLEFLCLNGILTGTTFESFSISHVRNAPDKVIDASYRVIADLPRLSEAVHSMQSRMLTHSQQLEFAEQAMALRYDGETKTPFLPYQINVARREGDNNATLWSTFNRVQENVMLGGAYAQVIGRNGRARRASMRPVKAINRNVTLNRQLWDLAETYVDRTPRPMMPSDYLELEAA